MESNDSVMSPMFLKVEKGANLPSNEFSIDTDQISDFQELYNSIKKFNLKPDWNFLRGDQEILIYKIKAGIDVPSLSVIIKVSLNLDIHVWIEGVPIDVKSCLWKLLGYDFKETEDVSLRYSMLLALIRFLDVNQLLVTDRKSKWHFDPNVIENTLKGNSPYCRICFKVSQEMTQLDVNTITFLKQLESSFVQDQSISENICSSCSNVLVDLLKFHEYLSQSQIALERFINPQKHEILENENDEKYILIRPNHIENMENSLKNEVNYTEEWLLEDDIIAESVVDDNPESESVEYQEEETIIEVETMEPMDYMSSEISHQANVLDEAPFPCLVEKPIKTKRAPIPPQPLIMPNEQGIFECNQCPKTYPSRTILNKHLYRVHSPATEKCPICEKMFNAYKLQCHMHFHELR